MFAYKTAVAVKNFGYRNIRIYNGGLKDWRKSGHKVDTIESLPDYAGKFLTAEELRSKIYNKADKACFSEPDMPNATIVDLRTEHHLKNAKRPVVIQTGCPIIYCLMDDLQKPQVRDRIPQKGLVVTITETGNRDKFAMQYLSKFGYENVFGLLFGMRGWIKAGYETTTPARPDVK